MGRAYFLRDVPAGSSPGESLVDAADLVRLFVVN